MPSRDDPRFRAGPASRSLAPVLAFVAPALAFGLGIDQAAAQSVANPRDQPTPATLPGAPEGAAGRADKPVSEVAPPSAITASTAVTASDRKGKAARTNPLDHLPARDRAGTGGRGE